MIADPSPHVEPDTRETDQIFVPPDDLPQVGPNSPPDPEDD